MLEEAAQNFGDRPFFVFPEQTITFAEMPGIVGKVAAVLADDYGLASRRSARNRGRELACVRAGRVGGGVARCGRRGAQRLVDRCRARVRRGAQRTHGRHGRRPAPRADRRGGYRDRGAGGGSRRRARAGRAARRDRAPDRRHRRRRPVAHPLHERHDRAPEGCDALASQSHPLRNGQRGGPGGVGGARGAAVGHWWQPGIGVRVAVLPHLGHRGAVHERAAVRQHDRVPTAGPVGSRNAPRAHRAAPRHELVGCAHALLADARASRLRHHRPVEPAQRWLGRHAVPARAHPARSASASTMSM